MSQVPESSDTLEERNDALFSVLFPRPSNEGATAVLQSAEICPWSPDVQHPRHAAKCVRNCGLLHEKSHYPDDGLHLWGFGPIERQTGTGVSRVHHGGKNNIRYTITIWRRRPVEPGVASKRSGRRIVGNVYHEYLTDRSMRYAQTAVKAKFP